jgi:SAM-dependent methyltransferase
MAGAVGMDIVPVPGVDVVADMSRGLPFKDNSLDGLVAYHVLEHLDDFLGIMGEIWRVCKDGARVQVKVPHAASPFMLWKDPTHRRGLTIATFAYFDDTYFDGIAFAYYSPARFRIEKAKLNFTLTDRQVDPAISRVRRVLNPIFDAVANRGRGYQYACERFWGPIVGIEEAVLTLCAMKPADAATNGAHH